VEARTGRLSTAQMQAVLGTEFGGMGDVLAELAQTDSPNRARWLAVARRFDHAAVMDPLAAGRDALSGLHANTQVPKWIGAARVYVVTAEDYWRLGTPYYTGEERYRAVAVNAWETTVRHHTYAIGGNSQAEHFRARDAISGFLSKDTAEACNTYNMLKLTRDLWTLSTNITAPGGTEHFDYYELALLNHLIPAQNPASAHGHITYFTPLNPGGRRGVGPAWGGGTWSTDYDSFWCCQGTQIETNTKLMDSIYFYQESNGALLWVQLFVPSVVRWEARGIVVRQTTAFPAGDGTELVVEKAGTTSFRIKVRIPAWAVGAEVSVNGGPASAIKSGTYAELGREWKDGDRISVKLPRRLRLVAANDKPGVAAVAYGPVVLSGKYGDTALTAMPGLALGSIKATQKPLEFTAQADGKTVTLGPFHEAHGHNYNVYWAVSGQLS